MKKVPLDMRKLQPNQKAWWLAIGLSALAPLSHAADAVKTSFSGFGTIVGTVSDTNTDLAFKNTVLQTKGATSGGPDFGLDSRIGLQGRAEFDPTISVTGQVIAQRTISKDFEPQFEWLYGQWSGVSGLDVRLGRVVLPAFMISDSRYVTYALPGVRAPVLVYSLLPFSFIDGAQATYRTRLASVNWSLTGTAGKYVGESTDANDVKNIVLSAESGDWLARYGFVGSSIKFNFGALGDIYFKDSFHNLGIQYDNGDYFSSVEYVLRKTKPNYFDANAWSITAGVRLGKWTPWATISRQTFKSDAAGVQIPGAPPGAVVVLATPLSSTKAFGAGIRYDVATNVAFKAEYGNYYGASGIILTPFPTAKERINLISIGLDFIF